MILEKGKEYSFTITIALQEDFRIGEGEVDEIISDALYNSRIEVLDVSEYMDISDGEYEELMEEVNDQ